MRPTKDDEEASAAWLPLHGDRGAAANELQCRILIEDRALELPERERRLDPERLDEHASASRYAASASTCRPER